MASMQSEFKAIFDEQFADLLGGGLPRAAAAAQALIAAQEIVRQRKTTQTIDAIDQTTKNVQLPVSSSSATPILPPAPPRQLMGIEIEQLEATASTCSESNDLNPLIKVVGNVFSSCETLNESFTGGLRGGINSVTIEAAPTTLDLAAVNRAYDLLASLGDSRVSAALSFALESLTTVFSLPSSRIVSVKPFIIFLEFKGLLDPSTGYWIRGMLQGFTKLSLPLKFQFFRWVLDNAGVVRFNHYLSIIRQFMTLQIYQGEVEDARMATKFLGVLYDARSMSISLQTIPLSEFYNDPLNEDLMQSREGRRVDFTHWVKERASRSNGNVRTSAQMRQIMNDSIPIITVSSVASPLIENENGVGTAGVVDNSSIARDASVAMDVEAEATSAVTAATTTAATAVDVAPVINRVAGNRSKPSFYDASATAAASTSAGGVSSAAIPSETAVAVAVAPTKDSRLPLNYTKLYTLSEGKSFIGHPFVLTPSTKATILELDAAMQMRQVMDSEIHTAMLTGQQYVVPYFVLRVSRERIVVDTISQVMLFEDTEFKKPLKIIFDGEEGVDAGGVRKEFYQVRIQFNDYYYRYYCYYYRCYYRYYCCYYYYYYYYYYYGYCY